MMQKYNIFPHIVNITRKIRVLGHVFTFFHYDIIDSLQAKLFFLSICTIFFFLFRSYPHTTIFFIYLRIWYNI